MVMVLGEVFGQLEASEAGVGDDPMDGTGLFEDREGAVGGALRELALGDKVRDRERLPGAAQPVHKGSPAGRVALTGSFEPRRDNGMHVSAHASPTVPIRVHRSR